MNCASLTVPSSLNFLVTGIESMITVLSAASSSDTFASGSGVFRNASCTVPNTRPCACTVNVAARARMMVMIILFMFQSFLLRVLIPVIHQMRHDVVRQRAVPCLGAALGVDGVLRVADLC